MGGVGASTLMSLHGTIHSEGSVVNNNNAVPKSLPQVTAQKFLHLPPMNTI